MTKRNKKPTEIVNHTVSFNVLDPDQNADRDFALNRSNFSGYVKLLIRLDRLRAEGTNPAAGMVIQPSPSPALQQVTGDVLVDDSMEDFT